jgi:hypothetical protein
MLMFAIACHSIAFNTYVIAATTTTTPDPLKISQCFRPRQSNNANVTLIRDQNGIAAIYTCHFGYRFTGGTMTRTAVCVDGNWLTDIDDCEGKLIVKLMHFDSIKRINVLCFSKTIVFWLKRTYFTYCASSTLPQVHYIRL